MVLAADARILRGARADQERGRPGLCADAGGREAPQGDHGGDRSPLHGAPLRRHRRDHPRGSHGSRLQARARAMDRPPRRRSTSGGEGTQTQRHRAQDHGRQDAPQQTHTAARVHRRRRSNRKRSRARRSIRARRGTGTRDGEALGGPGDEGDARVADEGGGNLSSGHLRASPGRNIRR